MNILQVVLQTFSCVCNSIGTNSGMLSNSISLVRNQCTEESGGCRDSFSRDAIGGCPTFLWKFWGPPFSCFLPRFLQPIIVVLILLHVYYTSICWNLSLGVVVKEMWQFIPLGLSVQILQHFCIHVDFLACNNKTCKIYQISASQSLVLNMIRWETDQWRQKWDAGISTSVESYSDAPL